MRNHHNSSPALIGASFAALATVALTAGSAFAADNSHGIGMTSGGGNKGLTATAPAQPCPAGEVAAANPTSGKPECVSASSINYNASKSNTGNVYFADLSSSGQAALRSLCAKHGGQVVSNAKGQLGCQVKSLDESKEIADGAAKGQASE